MLRFLREVDKAVPPEQDVHIVLDNYATHKHGKVRRWLKRNKRVHLHFTPTSSSWLNPVERFFARLSEQRLRRGAFTSVCHLEKSLKQYLDTYNESPRPLAWTKSTEEILEKVGRARAKLAAASELPVCCVKSSPPPLGGAMMSCLDASMSRSALSCGIVVADNRGVW